MDFNDTPEEAAYRAEVVAWLSANAKPYEGRIARKGLTTVHGHKIEESRRWQAKKFAAGYAGITIAREHGGPGGTPMKQVIYAQEENKFEVPPSVFEIAVGIGMPTLIAWGSSEQKERYVAKALSGDEVWCQLFSEPSAGSDLASIRLRATRDGDDWILNGQKVWTTGAHYSDFGTIIARTDPSAPKHKGLTTFVVDMKAPGVEVRPIRTMEGEAEFNEVFFTDVRVPDANRLGPVGGGWKVAMSTLMYERLHVGIGIGLTGWEQLIKIADEVEIGDRPAIEDSRVRERIADCWIGQQGLHLLTCRALTALSQGQIPGPEQSINKAVEASQGQQAAYFALDLLGERGGLDTAAMGEDWENVTRSWMWGAAFRIAGGTDEVLRNIIAERVLGLPGDLRSDKDAPFNQLTA